MMILCCHCDSGKMRIIRYTAGKDGFKAEGDIFQVIHAVKMNFGISLSIDETEMYCILILRWVTDMSSWKGELG